MAPIDEHDLAKARDLATAIQDGIHNLETTPDVQSRDSVVNACQKLVAILKPTDVALSEIAFAVSLCQLENVNATSSPIP